MRSIKRRINAPLALLKGQKRSTDRGWKGPGRPRPLRPQQRKPRRQNVPKPGSRTPKVQGPGGPWAPWGIPAELRVEPSAAPGRGNPAAEAASWPPGSGRSLSLRVLHCFWRWAAHTHRQRIARRRAHRLHTASALRQPSQSQGFGSSELSGGLGASHLVGLGAPGPAGQAERSRRV